MEKAPMMEVIKSFVKKKIRKKKNAIAMKSLSSLLCPILAQWRNSSIERT
jgi:hypothetical protein